MTSNSVASKLIGFSIRVPEVELARLWDDRRRQVHLLRPEVRAPLSIDDAVWPVPDDVNDYLVERGLGEVDSNPLNLMPSIPEEWAQNGLPSEVGKGYRLIAATVTESGFAALEATYNAIMYASGTALASVVLPKWKNLGFDIIDNTGISGLTNCGLGGAVEAEQRSRLAAQLNDHGLVKQLAAAREIVEILDRTVSEHQPFLPVQVWQAM